jgi:hypothetical protein
VPLQHLARGGSSIALSGGDCGRRAFLRNLGLGQYGAAFRDNEIDAEVLPDLTDADLEKLGVLMGHRKRLLKAIAGLSRVDRECPSGQPAAEIESQPHDPAPNAVS